jgi:Arc/MetJ family transcription regulator
LTEIGFSVNMAEVMRKKTTVYIDDELLRSAKVAAVREGKKEYEVFEGALRSYLGLEIASNTWARSDLDEDEALELSYGETHAERKKPRATAKRAKRS